MLVCCIEMDDIFDLILFKHFQLQLVICPKIFGFGFDVQDTSLAWLYSIKISLRIYV